MWLTHLTSLQGKKHVFPTYSLTDESVSGIYSAFDGKHYTNGDLKDKEVYPPDSSSPHSDIKFAIASDWGSGTMESAAVAELMRLHDADYTVHMGDVYYESLPEEIDVSVLGKSPNPYQQGVTWPDGKLGTFMVSGNHELLSLANGFFDTLLPSKNQLASYMSLETDHWRVIGLDSGYNSYNVFGWINGIDELSETDAPQPQEIIDWLNNTVKLQVSARSE